MQGKDGIDESMSEEEESGEFGDELEEAVNRETGNDEAEEQATNVVETKAGAVVVEDINSTLKPDTSELPKNSSNRDTMSYLKSKRILRHKNNEAIDSKKQKMSD